MLEFFFFACDKLIPKWNCHSSITCFKLLGQKVSFIVFKNFQPDLPSSCVNMSVSCAYLLKIVRYINISSCAYSSFRTNEKQDGRGGGE